MTVYELVCECTLEMHPHGILKWDVTRYAAAAVVRCKQLKFPPQNDGMARTSSHGTDSLFRSGTAFWKRAQDARSSVAEQHTCMSNRIGVAGVDERSKAVSKRHAFVRSCRGSRCPCERDSCHVGSVLMPVVSEWRDRNASDNNSTSASLRGAQSSFASASLATSTLPSSAASRRNSSRLSYGTAGIYSPANGSPFDNSAHHRWSLPHSVPGNCTPTLAFDAPVNGPPHLPADLATHQVADEAINNESPISQQSSGCPSTSLSEKIRGKLPAFKKKDLRKWVCPVCCHGFSMSETMRDHIKKQCLNPTTYQCLSCPYSTRKPTFITKHCGAAHVPDRGYREYTPPARNVYASSLTGKLHSTEKELIEDTHRHCLQSKDVPPSDPNTRLKALLWALLTGANGQQMKQEMNSQCLFWGVDPTSWLTLTWETEDALRLSDMAEYGLQCDAASTLSHRADISIEVAASGLEQHKLGIADLGDYAADLMQSALGNQRPTTLGQQFELAHSPKVAAAQQPALIKPEHFAAHDEPFVFDAQTQEFAMSEPTRSNQHDSLNGQTHDQGYTRLHVSTDQDHNSYLGRSSNRPHSVVMLDCFLSNNYWFKGDQSNSSH
jgi:hypothetical protein